MKNDSNFQLSLDSNSTNYLNKSAVLISDSSSTRLEISVLNFLPSDTNLVISFNLRNAPALKQKFVGMNTKIVNNKGIIVHTIERGLENNITLRTLKFFEDSYDE